MESIGILFKEIVYIQISTVSGTAFHRLDTVAVRTQSTLTDLDCKTLFHDLERHFADGTLHNSTFLASDLKKKEVCILGLDGILLATIGAAEFVEYPHAITTDEHGNLLVADGGGVIDFFNVDSQQRVANIETAEGIRGILAGNGFLYVCTGGVDYIRKIKYPAERIYHLRQQLNRPENTGNEEANNSTSPDSATDGVAAAHNLL